jgi:hypothetical protein
MLDDIYKAAVILITDKYVHDEDDFPAGSAAIALFDAIGKKGWHTVRLVDASGEPIDEENAARDGFETMAIEKIRQGSSFVDRVEQEGGRSFLLAATPIPVVMQKCTMCHPNYEHVREGQAIGALTYRVPIE